MSVGARKSYTHVPKKRSKQLKKRVQRFSLNADFTYAERDVDQKAETLGLYMLVQERQIGISAIINKNI